VYEPRHLYQKQRQEGNSGQGVARSRTGSPADEGELLSNNLIDRSTSPDANAGGLLRDAVDALRYEVPRPLEPDEVPGIVAKMIPSGARVLDVGCGEGTLSKVLSDACHAEVLGLEPDPARAECAMARGLNVRVVCFDRELVRDLGRFDIVLFADVLEHLANPQTALLLSHEVLKGGGAVIASIPNVAHWSVRADLLRGRFRYQPCGIMDATHLRWFTADSAKSLIVSAGFNIVEYRAAAGVAVPDNLYRAPLCWLPANQRARFLRTACRHWPTLFGSQHVLKAEVQ
jgi:methionine biosynthesis protein MetW